LSIDPFSKEEVKKEEERLHLEVFLYLPVYHAYLKKINYLRRKYKESHISEPFQLGAKMRGLHYQRNLQFQ